MSATDERKDRRARKIVMETRLLAQDARNDFYDALASGQAPPPRVIQNLRSVVLKYWSVLRVYRDHDAIAEKWDEYDLNSLGSKAIQTVDIETDAAGWGNKKEMQQAPAVLELGPAQCHHYINVFEDLANDLGFVADPQQVEADPSEAVV